MPSCVPEVAQKRGVEEAKTENHGGGAARCGDPPRVRAWWFPSHGGGPSEGQIRLRQPLTGQGARAHDAGLRDQLQLNKGPGARAGHFPSFFSLFYNAKNPFFRKIHSFSKPVPLPPVRKNGRRTCRRRANALYLKQRHSLILILVYEFIR